ncbi:MAG TPA: ankyrin repeat domain-containing protein [Candidatus Limnocylindria bacterium]|nr:ankyrin repeat domain-containing protein [Candidatus Limnocylindria bacterium]
MRFGFGALLLGTVTCLAGVGLVASKRSVQFTSDTGDGVVLSGPDKPSIDVDLTHEEIIRKVRWSSPPKLSAFLVRNRPSQHVLHLMLTQAICRKKTGLVEVLAGQGLDLEHCVKGSLTPLGYAVETMDIPMIRLLLEKGALINGPDKSGCTALHIAVDTEVEMAYYEEDTRRKPHEPRCDLCLFLLQAGADCEIRNHQGKSPLDWAIERKHAAAVSAMTAHLTRKDRSDG